MLGGLDPILLFNFFQRSPALDEFIESTPVVKSVVDLIGLPPIPIYLGEQLTGIFVAEEEKTIAIQTDVETDINGNNPKVIQKGIESSISVNLLARRDSVGLTLLSALADFAFTKVTSQEYTITYLHGPITVFNGLIQSFSIDQNSNDTLYRVRFELSRARSFVRPKPGPPLVPTVPAPVVL